MDEILLKVLSLTHAYSNGDQVALGALDLSDDVALLLVRDPARLLGIIRFGLVDALLLQRDVQELCGVGVGSGALQNNVARHVEGWCLKAVEVKSDTQYARTALELSCNRGRQDVSHVQVWDPTRVMN